MGELKCESLNHPRAECWGPLKRCTRCLKAFCMAEGADEESPELCDGCFDAEIEALGVK
ncbi:MAG: hypothetical protein RX318_03820 [bacterium]|nr:hypothetical protein [bacterium]